MALRTIIAAAALAASLGLAQAAETVHRLAVHVNEADPAVMSLALNNIDNVRKFYEAKGETVIVELVTYGPGLAMLTEASPVRDRIATLSLEAPDTVFTACGNTKTAMEKAGKTVTLLPEATIAPSGVVRLIELQEQGYAYVKP